MTCPDEEGIETLAGESFVDKSLPCPMTCPDEEGIETTAVSASQASATVCPMTCPDEEGIETWLAMLALEKFPDLPDDMPR